MLPLFKQTVFVCSVDGLVSWFWWFLPTCQPLSRLTEKYHARTTTNQGREEKKKISGPITATSAFFFNRVNKWEPSQAWAMLPPKVNHIVAALVKWRFICYFHGMGLFAWEFTLGVFDYWLFNRWQPQKDARPLSSSNVCACVGMCRSGCVCVYVSVLQWNIPLDAWAGSKCTISRSRAILNRSVQALSVLQARCQMCWSETIM